ncbi:MAG: hypothetical protein JSW68_15045 [Burkholderiales bacterium]|nr:MAG: hypothetical protein JSW68_15045 [Burkholderiales bacterium]
MRTMYLAALGGALALALTACGQETAVKLHEPGKYVGEKDPLLEKSRSAQHDEAMKQRFLLVQTDR